MNRDEYRNVYLRSPEWQERRRVALANANGRCQICNGANRLDVHHRTYERLGREEPTDLTVLCRACHDLFHSFSGVVQRGPQKNSSQNWSKMDEQARAVCRDRLLGLLWRNGPATPQELHAQAGYRSQVIGACFVSVRRLGLVRRHKSRWSLTAKGKVAMAKSGVAA